MSEKNQLNEDIPLEEELIKQSSEFLEEIQQTRKKLEDLEQKLADNLEALKRRIKQNKKDR